jgi:mRNA interferase MazF
MGRSLSGTLRVQRRVDPARGEIWFGDLDPVRGHEQGGPRPVLIISPDLYNQGPATLVVVLPLTTTRRPVRWHVPIHPPEGGVKRPSVILCDAVRSVTKERLTEQWGVVSPATLTTVEDRLRILFSL